jgi:hypothetical protein
MDTIFPLKSKKTIKAINQAVSHNNAMMRLKIQNALYQQELNRVRAANDLANAALAQQQEQAARAVAALALAERQQHEAAALAQQQEQAARAAAALALAQRHQTGSSLDLVRRTHHEEQVAAQKRAQEAAQAQAQALVADLHNKKSSKFGKLLSKMNKQH